MPRVHDDGQQTATNIPSIAVDLDGTILAYGDFDGRTLQYGPPLPGAKEALERFRSWGFRIIVYTCRTNPAVVGKVTAQRAKEKIAQILEEHEIPFDEVAAGASKPLAILYIDDRGFRFRNNWSEVVKFVVDTFLPE